MSSLVKSKNDKAIRRKNRLDRLTIFDAINYLIMLGILFITLYPVWYVLCISLSSTVGINSGQVTFWPRGFSLDAYAKILSTPKIPRAYWNSILYTTVATVFNLLMTILFSYPLARKTFVLRKPIMIMIIITMYFTGGLIPTFLLVNSVGLIDSMWALVIPNLIWTFDVIILKNFFEGIPTELYEAAIIDGAKEFTILTRIFVPLAKPAIASISLFFIMGNWNSYLIPSIYITTYEKYPLQVLLRDMLMQNTELNSSLVDEASRFTPEALKNATIFISIVPFLLVYPYLQKFFIKGLTLGAVKG